MDCTNTTSVHLPVLFKLAASPYGYSGQPVPNLLFLLDPYMTWHIFVNKGTINLLLLLLFDSWTPTGSHYLEFCIVWGTKRTKKKASSLVPDFLSNMLPHAHWLWCRNSDFWLASVDQKMLVTFPAEIHTNPVPFLKANHESVGLQVSCFKQKMLSTCSSVLWMTSLGLSPQFGLSKTLRMIQYYPYELLSQYDNCSTTVLSFWQRSTPPCRHVVL